MDHKVLSACSEYFHIVKIQYHRIIAGSSFKSFLLSMISSKEHERYLKERMNASDGERISGKRMANI